MALVINAAECTGCGQCASNCPTGAISTDMQSFTMIIDSQLCTECRGCQANCPVDCIQDSIEL